MADADTDAVPFLHEYMLTTVDNPYDPFNQFDEWYAWDRDAGYHTPSLLGRIVWVSNDISEADQHMQVQSAIDEIVEMNVSGMHKKVRRTPTITPSSLTE